MFERQLLTAVCVGVRHREETAPLLFGDGSIDLQDPDSPVKAAKTKGPPKDVLANNKKYGSVHVDDDDNDEERATSTVASRSVRTETSDTLTKAAIMAKPHVPSQNPCLWLFHLLQGIGVIVCLCLLTTQILPLVLIPRKEIMDRIGPLAIALKAYISLFCILFMLVESDLPVPFVRSSNLLQRYMSRGFLYSFIGLICVEEANSERVREIVSGKNTFQVGWAAVFMQISSWFMLGIGALYVLMGVCCLKRLKDKMKEKEIEDWRKYRAALKAWKDVYG